MKWYVVFEPYRSKLILSLTFWFYSQVDMPNYVVREIMSASGSMRIVD
jgi:hypothetical protein